MAAYATVLLGVLNRPCIADTSLLNNFVHSSAYMLERILRRPIRLSPTVLDARETRLPEFPRVQPSFYMSRSTEHAAYGEIAPFIQSFALGVGDRWEPVEPDSNELALASRLSSREIREEVRTVCPGISRKKVELDSGEAEAAAIAATRGWTFLTDDQASVEFLRCLYPNIPIQRTCTLLLYAVEREVLSCEEAADRFNRRIVEELGFWAFRRLAK
ncbi:hypothetical protein GBA63_18040 [Rubrobacter tropicus]|uniref:Uncharacterized protein n=1 Tax=Rubrobacter tropicus TaxID=2653851 RepID=A0A6G8QD59_9ACTN|nr:hypothetical protein [Rubrobacter tropicus]QIN84331.1 hypothetical protein GBA63_18040 [Rubrobacter tropicus]